MPSRKLRKRYRQRAEATAKGPGSAGGWGKGLPLTRRDLLLVRQAIREGWDLPDGVRPAIIENIFHEALAPECDPRLQIAAVRCLLTMVEDDQRIRHAAIDELRAQGHEVLGYADEDCTAILYRPAAGSVR